MSGRRRSHLAERLFACSQRLYPGPFHDEYAKEMRAVFRQRWQEEAASRGAAGMALFSAEVIGDTFYTACKEHLSMLFYDIKFAVRTLARSPLFAVSAILTIGLGIGANTAIFSVVDHVVLRPLPFPHSERLLAIRLPHPTENEISLSSADFLDWRSQNRTVESLAAYTNRMFTLGGDGEPVMISGSLVTDEIFSTLGVNAFLGRVFVRGDDAPSQARTVVLSYQLWRTRFREDAHIVGKTILLDSQPHSIIGVMGAEFAFPSQQEMLWVIQPMAPPARRGPYVMTGIGRMKDGMTVAAAAAEMNASIHPTFGAVGRGNREKPIQFILRPLREEMVAGYKTSLLILFGAGSLVLLIACVNVANLLLGRSAAREREILLRISLGASMRQLFRQFLTESMLIAGAGAFFGMAIAAIAVQMFNSFGQEFVPHLGSAAIDGRILLFTGISVVISGLLFGLAPTRYALRLRVNEGLHSTRSTNGPQAERARMLLILGEVALATVLVAGAGLLIRSYARLLDVDPGTRADHVMTFRLSPPSRRYPPPTAINQFYERLLDRIRQNPAVITAGAGSGLPPDRLAFSDDYTFEDRPPAPGEPIPVAPVVIITPGYFSAIGLPILRGRDFAERDTMDRPPVAIISHAMALKHFPGEDPIGKRMRQGGPDRENPWMEIVGVVADAKYTGLDVIDSRAYYKVEAQSGMSSMYVAVRTRVSPESVVKSLREAVASIDKELALDRVQSMDQNLAESIARPRFRMRLFAGLSALGLGLAAIGVYGVVAYTVTRRTSELGIRLALGAERSKLLWLVIRQGMKPVAAGLVLGIGGALGLGRTAQSILFGTEPQDPPTLLVTILVLGVVGILACLLPALRATRIDPAVALRNE